MSLQLLKILCSQKLDLPALTYQRTAHLLCRENVRRQGQPWVEWDELTSTPERSLAQGLLADAVRN